MSRLLIASTNPGKLVEIQALLSDLKIKLVTPGQLGVHLDVEEGGDTYAENATRKGLVYANRCGLITLADDSGLEVEALGGQPGVRSARFAPQTGATDADRRAYLLSKLKQLPRPWLARFRCVVALVTPAGDVHLSEGECQGEIIPDERGEHGFGYDPIFYLPDLGLTMAELDMQRKNQLSHRSRAILAARPILTELMNNTST